MLRENLITSKRIKFIILGFIVFSLGIILYVVVTNLSHLGKVAVEIKYAPFEAAVFIDDENYPVNNAVNWLEPGPHHITVVLNGFKTVEQDVTITDETKCLYGALRTLNENDTKLYQKYQNDYIEVEGIAGEKTTQDAEILTNKWPILNYLPYIKDDYAIGTLFDEQNRLVIIVRAASSQVDNAINKLRSFESVNLSEYSIEIKGFDNILAGKFSENNNSDPIAFLKDGYSGLALPYQVNLGQQSGDYYFTTISVTNSANSIPTTYRAILQTSGASWRLLSTPYPLLTVSNTPDVDSSVLDAANYLNPPLL